ncbi:DUF2975 domain-containing protein [Streptococcus saliviloxodontae]|uniref:Neutral ceramidase superfamily lipid hydrolase n=1 Tax=Streptococcus saliviloxodontae TaxID=1349416 RepID=A0ABS2PIV0_9STRE|nr:DUF2975 domain-containing protein [Streptococcus saliviloxodontae]MBM7635359.1 putative neutral ceramidase superfamily lipid hydrolase [Streptococcus saliviloxodontae]
MKNDTKKMKWILRFVTVCYYINIIAIVAYAAIAGIIGVAASFGKVEFLSILAENGINWSYLEALSFGSLLAVFGLVEIVVLLLLLKAIRRFLSNIISETIFVQENVILAKKASLLLLILAITNLGSFIYLFASLLVWVIAKVLEKAIAIAEENEFTI